MHLKWQWFKRNWGFAIFVVDIVGAFLSIAIHQATGHYINYTEPARYLWRGEDPYGITFPGSPGAFFYSPGCALYFYGLFTLLPDRLGQFLYMGISFAVFGRALRNLLKYLKTNGLDLQTSPYRHLFWLMAGSEALGSIIAVKIDLLIVGLVLWAMVSLLEKRGEFLAFVVLGLFTSFKLHPVMIVGLLLIALFAKERRNAIRLGIYFSIGIVIGLLSPWLAISSDLALRSTRHWSTEIDRFVSVAWLDDIFQHLYGFVARSFHVKVNLGIANKITAVCGTATAAALLYGSRKSTRQTAILISVGLGSGFVVMFSHLIQSNSYIVYFPLVISFIWMATQLNWSKTLSLTILSCAFLLISIFYSDLTPRPLYHFLYECGVKPLGVLLLFLCVLIGLGKSLKRYVVPFETFEEF